jgi:hypothetical protein
MDKDKLIPEENLTEEQIQEQGFLMGGLKSITNISIIVEILIQLLSILLNFLKKEKKKSGK